ncbi:MAG: hypothetical protein CMJ39_07205 [Phycisphaerae bacterium]|nr:hypothetical protein [Phycisphaerae bacterium]|tara:strand:+ start:893 stop:1486 length:594 start_codon:yes stop_codon:yes gene_type:complete
MTITDTQNSMAQTLPAPRRSLYNRLDDFISRLSTRNNFWHRVCSLIWLPFAWKSGITMKRLGTDRFTAILPFKRVNRNWYNAMAGAALLGNSEVAAGMFLFKECGSDYAVVCKDMHYRFLRPCLGPAVYRIVDGDDTSKEIHDLINNGGEFNVDLELEIAQIIKDKGRQIRVGRCNLTFHCTPKTMVRERRLRRNRS